MKLKYSLLLLPMSGIVIALILLFNFTAPNPTGRRYSSEIVITEGSSSAKGISGETILSQDLGFPRNDIGTSRMCILALNLQPCSNQRGEYRPDFITDRYIIDAKNHVALIPDRNHVRDLEQLTAFAQVAAQTGRSFWVYVRVDTIIDPLFVELTERTGGGVIPYFRVEGWYDPVDQIAQILLIVSIIAVGVVLILFWLESLPEVPDDPRDDQRGGKLDEAERFAKRAKERARAQSENYRLN